MIVSGTCATTLGAGYVEEAALNARMPLGTLAASLDIGTTGGADTITGVINHTHPVVITDNGHSHTQASQTATTGAVSSWEHGAIDTSSTAAETLPTGSATTGITATTSNPAGGVASIDNRSAFARVIFCRKT